MPYIKQKDRQKLNAVSGLLNHYEVTNAGELNYLLTKVIHRYFKSNGNNYQAINDIIGALEGAKLEFYRRIVAPYESDKIKENGDV